MASTVESAERTRAKESGAISTTLTLPLRITLLLLGSLLLSLIFEWIGLAFFWNNQGWQHAQSMFNNELMWLSDTFKQSVIIREPGKTVTALLNLVYDWIFVKSGFYEFTQEAKVNAQDNSFIGYASTIYLQIENYVMASIYTVMTFCVRVMILTLSIPLFLLAIMVGGTDGLMRRDLRRFGAGRESSFVYHRAKQCVVPLLVAPWFIYLTLPVSVKPLYVLIPCAVMLGIAVMITAATFKKYL